MSDSEVEGVSPKALEIARETITTVAHMNQAPAADLANAVNTIVLDLLRDPDLIREVVIALAGITVGLLNLAADGLLPADATEAETARSREEMLRAMIASLVAQGR